MISFCDGVVDVGFELGMNANREESLLLPRCVRGLGSFSHLGQDKLFLWSHFLDNALDEGGKVFLLLF